MSVLPHVLHAEYRGAYRIHLAFDDGREKTGDFAPCLQGPVFEPQGQSLLPAFLP